MLPTWDRSGRLHLIRQTGGATTPGENQGPAAAIVLDVASGTVLSQRDIEPVRDQTYDSSGTYLIRTFTNGAVEYRDADGALVALGSGYLSAAW
jgi:hypothetical protein